MRINLYQSDVKFLSDAELASLSEELYEAYVESYTLPCECCTDSEWTDEAAEARYHEIRREMFRRYDEAHPEQAETRRKLLPLSLGWVSRQLLAALSEQSSVGAQITAAFDDEFRGVKVGDTITIRKPGRYRI